MKRRLFKFIFLFIVLCLNKKAVSADNCYFNVQEKDVFKNDIITVEIGLKEYISNIDKAVLFLEYDENALELINKKIIVNNGWELYNNEEIIDNINTINTLAFTIGTNNPALYINKNSDIVLLSLKFNVKEDFYGGQTTISFSPSKDHGYFNSKSVIANKENETSIINCNTKEIKLTIKEKINEPIKESSNKFILYFLFITILIAVCSIIIVINNMKMDKK